TDEPHPTFVENALAKARHASRISRLPALADDSGVCVAALSGVPGVQSARYAGEPRSDRRNNEKLIADLAGIDDRRAHYYCVLALMRHGEDPAPTLALYIHIPWCIRKCPYCDFNSHEKRGEVPEAQYVEALTADLEFALPSIWGRRIGSVFLGGGTPSLFSPEAIDRILAAVRARVSVAPDAEITLEAKPGTFEQAKFAGFRAAGVNRLSLGVQSFNPVHLSALGRVHDEREARTAAAAAVEIFGNVNLDLMYALPGQTVKEARADVAEALAFATPHLSFYH